MNFKQYLIEQMSNPQNEADVLLHQIMHNIDEGHVEYADERFDFNVGILVKRSGYVKLYFSVFNKPEDKINVKLGKNNQKEGFTIVVETKDYPSRGDIDKFFGNKLVYNAVKSELIKYISEYKEDSGEFRTTYESDKEINTDENFEKMYSEVVADIKKRVEEYKGIVKEINDELENTADEHRKQILVRSIEKLKDEYFGDTFKRFKRLAADSIDIDMTRLEKEYKKKFDSRLEDFYENIIYTL